MYNIWLFRSIIIFILYTIILSSIHFDINDYHQCNQPRINFLLLPTANAMKSDEILVAILAAKFLGLFHKDNDNKPRPPPPPPPPPPIFAPPIILSKPKRCKPKKCCRNRLPKFLSESSYSFDDDDDDDDNDLDGYGTEFDDNYDDGNYDDNGGGGGGYDDIGVDINIGSAGGGGGYDNSYGKNFGLPKNRPFPITDSNEYRSLEMNNNNHNNNNNGNHNGNHNDMNVNANYLHNNNQMPQQKQRPQQIQMYASDQSLQTGDEYNTGTNSMENNDGGGDMIQEIQPTFDDENDEQLSLASKDMIITANDKKRKTKTTNIGKYLKTKLRSTTNLLSINNNSGDIMGKTRINKENRLKKSKQSKRRQRQRKSEKQRKRHRRRRRRRKRRRKKPKSPKQKPIENDYDDYDENLTTEQTIIHLGEKPLTNLNEIEDNGNDQSQEINEESETEIPSTEDDINQEMNNDDIDDAEQQQYMTVANNNDNNDDEITTTEMTSVTTSESEIETSSSEKVIMNYTYVPMDSTQLSHQQQERKLIPDNIRKYLDRIRLWNKRKLNANGMKPSFQKDDQQKHHHQQQQQQRPLSSAEQQSQPQRLPPFPPQIPFPIPIMRPMFPIQSRPPFHPPLMIPPPPPPPPMMMMRPSPPMLNPMIQHSQFNQPLKSMPTQQQQQQQQFQSHSHPMIMNSGQIVGEQHVVYPLLRKSDHQQQQQQQSSSSSLPTQQSN